MNSDGWGQVGAGPSDRRIAGDDLQHYTQNLKASERPTQHRIVRHEREDGGPMKQNLKDRLDESLSAKHGPESAHMQSMASRRHESEGMTHHHAPHHKHHMHHHLEAEKHRHEAAMEHHHHHLARHHGRHYDSQHGHDNYSY